MATIASKVIDRPISGDGEQPAEQRSARWVEELGPVPQRQERLLDDLDRDRLIPARPRRLGEHGAAVTVVEMRERHLRALDQTANQAGV